jgi:hypothetical protein
MSRRKVLTDAQVREIRAQHKPGVRGKGYGALAKLHNCGESTVRDVVKYWTRVKA